MVAKYNQRGFFEWIIQRVTAIIIGIYGLFIFGFILSHQPMQFSVWHAMFSHIVIKIATFLVVLAILWHAWIGLWTVFTDYIKCGSLRLVLEILVILLLASYFVWCLDAVLKG